MKVIVFILAGFLLLQLLNAFPLDDEKGLSSIDSGVVSAEVSELRVKRGLGKKIKKKLKKAKKVLKKVAEAAVINKVAGAVAEAVGK